MTTPDKPTVRPRWVDRIAISRKGGGFAYVPGRVLVRGPARTRALDVLGRSGAGEEKPETRFTAIDDVPDPLGLVELLRAEGLDAQPEHVFFAHPCDPCETLPHPWERYGPGADPWRSHAIAADPWRSHAVQSTPWRSHPWRSHEAPTSSAAPMSARALPMRACEGPGRHPQIVVLDTGLAGGDQDGGVNADGQRPALLLDAAHPDRISGPSDAPDVAITSVTGQVFGPDNYLDPVAGHGTFIAGIIEQLAPGCTIRVEHVVSPLGDGRELDICNAIDAAVGAAAGPPDIISMSFGGPVWDNAQALRTSIAAAHLAGVVLVASAGNDGVCTPQYPGAYDNVTAVAAVGPDGPPEWTNYGGWVDACAPGVDIVSAFFASFDGAFPRINATDVDAFSGWAQWSGTSFSAPVVVAAIAREMVTGPCSASDAVERVIGAPHLLRLPCLGTVVNL